MGFMQSSSDPCMYSSNKSSTLESMWTTLSWPDVLRLSERGEDCSHSKIRAQRHGKIAPFPWNVRGAERRKQDRVDHWRTGIYQECYQEIWNAGLYSS